MYSTIEITETDKVSLELHGIIQMRKEVLGGILDIIRFGENFIKYFDTLKELLKKANDMIHKEEKDIKCMEELANKVKKFKGLSPRDPKYNEDLMSFVQAKSLSDGNNPIAREETLSVNEKINNLLNKMEQMLNKKSVPRHKSRDNDPCDILVNDDSTPNQVHKTSVKIPKNSEIMLRNYGKKYFINDIKCDPNNIKKFTSELTSSEKQCEKCGKFKKYALILGKNCVICIKCIKEIYYDNGSKLYSIFEAQKNKAYAMCVCPTHGSNIRPHVLGKILGGLNIEISSISSTKQHLKGNKGFRKLYPVLCVECKNLIKNAYDKHEAIYACNMHHICTKCYP